MKNNMISAYMTVFDDWSILGTAVQSIYDVVDEIVIVDGAYKWMEPFFRKSGRDCSRSNGHLYEALNPFVKKLRIVNGLWEDESSKRCAAYAACRGDIIIRADADEVIFFNQRAMDNFIRSDFCVAEMEMPIYVAPGLIKQRVDQRQIERQSFVFKRPRVSAVEHLSYLWLVLPKQEDERRLEKNSRFIYPNPVAFNAHLTHWRSPNNALARARFYVLNYLRGGGNVNWIPGFTYLNDSSLEQLSQVLSLVVLDGILLGHPIVACPPDTKSARFQKSPLSHADESKFSQHYLDMLSNLSALNRLLVSQPRSIASGTDYHIDLSSPFEVTHSEMEIQFSSAIISAKVQISFLLEDANVINRLVAYRIAGSKLSFNLELSLPENLKCLRKTLALCVWTGEDPKYMTMIVEG